MRTLIGGLFIGHGTQKLFGWFGGHGPEGTGQFFESLGLSPGKQNAIAAGAAGGGGAVTGWAGERVWPWVDEEEMWGLIAQKGAARLPDHEALYEELAHVLARRGEVEAALACARGRAAPWASPFAFKLLVRQGRRAETSPLEAAVAGAAITVTRAGAAESMPSRDEIDRALASPVATGDV